MTALTMTPATPLTSAEPFLRCMVGGHTAATTDLVLTDAEHLGPLSEVQGLIGPSSTVFVPEGSIVGSRRNGARIVEYAGELSVLGEEIVLAGELPVRVEAYSDLESLIITGPTIVRIDSEDDYLAFLADADAAMSTGEFSETLAPGRVARRRLLPGRRHSVQRHLAPLRVRDRRAARLGARPRARDRG